MKQFFGAIALLLTMGAQAATESVHLNMTLKMHEHIVARPQVKTALGQPATLSQKNQDGSGYEIIVTPIRSPRKSAGQDPKAVLLLSFEVSRLEGDRKTLVARPRVMVPAGEKATVSQSGEEPFELGVTPLIVSP